MKKLFCVLVLAAGVLAAAGQSGNEFYVRIYSVIQEADTLAASMQNVEALKKYREAESALQNFQRGNPEWNPAIIRYRLSYLAERIAEVSPKVPPGQLPTAKAVAPGVGSDPASSGATAALEGQADVLRGQVRLLQAERAKLESKLKEALAIQPAAIDPRELTKAEQRIQELQKENDLLKVSLEQAKTRKVQEPAQPLPAAEDSEATVALRAENELLKNQLAQARQKPAVDPSYQTKLSEIETRMAAVQSDKEILLLEKKALQARVRALEAEPVPYTPEELALFKAPQPTLAPSPTPAPEEAPAATPAPGSTTAGFSASTAALAKEGEKLFAAGRLEQAQAKFLEVLKQDRSDVVTLANLAVVELDLNHGEAAEKHISQAVALAPEDAFSLGVLGRLRFQQKRMDEALDALSKAAKLDPKSPEIQNYLGLVLSEKGMRPAAESALRKAVQLRPSYGSAHQNLAVVYVTQNPPLVELARYHYNKSLAAGTPPNPNLEKMIESKRGAR